MSCYLWQQLSLVGSGRLRDVHRNSGDHPSGVFARANTTKKREENNLHLHNVKSAQIELKNRMNIYSRRKDTIISYFTSGWEKLLPRYSNVHTFLPLHWRYTVYGSICIKKKQLNKPNEQKKVILNLLGKINIFFPYQSMVKCMHTNVLLVAWLNCGNCSVMNILCQI